MSIAQSRKPREKKIEVLQGILKGDKKLSDLDSFRQQIVLIRDSKGKILAILESRPRMRGWTKEEIAEYERLNSNEARE